MGVLDGKVAVVTRSGQGIGRGVALGLAREGARVITNNRAPRDASKLEYTHRIGIKGRDFVSEMSPTTTLLAHS